MEAGDMTPRTATPRSVTPSRRNTDTAFNRDVLDGDVTPRCEDVGNRFRRGCIRLRKPQETPPPPVLVEFKSGKKQGYVAADTTEINLGMRIADTDIHDPCKSELRKEQPLPAGKASRDIAVAANKLEFQRGGPASTHMFKSFTDPVTHLNYDFAYAGVREPNPPGMEDAAGLMTGQLTLQKCRWFTVARGLGAGEYSPRITGTMSADPLNDNERGHSRKKGSVNPDARKSRTGFLSHVSKIVELTDDELREIRKGRQSYNNAGQWQNNVAGLEDLLPGAWAPCLKCDIPASVEYQQSNSKRLLQPFERRVHVSGDRPLISKKSTSSDAFLQCLVDPKNDEDSAKPPAEASARQIGASASCASLRAPADGARGPPKSARGGRVTPFGCGRSASACSRNSSPRK